MKALTVKGTPRGEYIIIRSGKVYGGVVATWSQVLKFGIEAFGVNSGQILFALDEQAARNIEAEVESASSVKPRMGMTALGTPGL